MALLTRNALETFSQFWRNRARALANVILVSSLPAQRIILQFREAGALTPATARPFRAQSRIEELEFRRLLRARIIREPLPGRYFLDQGNVERTRLWLDA